MAEKSGSEQIDDIIANLDGWKADALIKIRSLIHQADPSVEEAVKWKMPSLPQGRPVWMHHGNMILAEVFKHDIKIVFFKGTQLKDRHGLFNARLKSSTDRAIELTEMEPEINAAAFKDLVTQAIEVNNRHQA